MFGSCSRNSCMVDEEVSTARRIKDGELLRYKAGFFGSKWTETYTVLMSDARLLLFNSRNESKATEYFHLVEALPFMCVGMLTERLPAKRPPLPEGSSINHLVGIALDSTGDKAYWLLFSTDVELQEWLDAMISILPPNNSGPPQLPPNGLNNSQQAVNYPTPSNQQHPQQGYPANTVIIQDHGPQSSGLALGGGILLGALAGYGIGSMFEPEVILAPADPSANAPIESEENFFFEDTNAETTEPQGFVLNDDEDGFDI